MKNKHLLLILLSIFGLIQTNNVVAKDFEEEELPIIVKNLQEWSVDYPTVTNNWNGLLLRSIEGNLPPILSVVTSINGIQTKGMSIKDFNNILMSDGTATLEYQKKMKGDIVTDRCKMKYHTKVYWGEGINLDYPEAFPNNIRLKVNKNVQLFYYNTYGFINGLENGLDDDVLLDAAGRSLRSKGLAKSEDDQPDVLLSLTTGKDEWNGTTIVLSMLDGKKLRQGVTQALWSLEISNLDKDIKNSLYSIKSAISKYCANYPFEIPAFAHKVRTLGIGFESKESMCTGQVIEVLKGSDAYKKGLRGGDTILGGYEGTSLYLYGNARKYWFKANKKHGAKNWTVGWVAIIPFPFYWKNNAEHYLTQGDVSGGFISECHFKILKSDGGKLTVAAPFREQRYNFKYIR